MEYLLIASVVSSIIGYFVSSIQQEKEFGQQNDLLRQQQDFTREREDLAYQRSRPDAQYDAFIDAGFNPTLAAQAVLGGDAATATAIGSPQAPTTNSAIQAMQSMIGQGGQNLYDAYLKDIQAKNIQANTDKTEVETGLLPRDYELRALSTHAQINLWYASVERIAKENEQSDQEIELLKQQNMYYGRMAEADLTLKEKEADKMVADAKLANEKANTESHVRKELDARAVLEGEQVNTERAKQAELYSQKDVNEAVAGATNTEQQIRAVDLEWVQKYGIPMTIDAQKYVSGLLEKGEYDKASTFLHSMFESARSQDLGKEYAKGKAKQQYPDYNFGVLRGSGQVGSPMYVPYWNPQQ